MVSFEDFKKLEIRIGRVISAEKIEGADRLLKLLFDFGTEQRQIIAGIAEYFPDPSVLVDRQMPVLVNLEPKMLKGFESQGMVLAIGVGDKAVLLHPDTDVPPGSMVR